MDKDTKKYVKKIIKILEKHGIVRAGIFGSYATEEATKGSDIDILIDFDGSLLDLIGLELELKKALKKNVDLLTYRGINPILKRRILDEEIKIIWKKTLKYF